MRTTDRPFEHGPERFKGVHAGIAARILFAPMIDRRMDIIQGG